MKKTIRTMQGKSIDFEKLILQNEKITAVGNMNVNAAGEKIKKVNNSVEKKNRSKKAYRRQIHNKVYDLPVMDSKADSMLYTAKMANEYIQNTSIPEIHELTVDTTDEVGVVGQAVVQVAPPMPKITSKENKENEVSDELLQEVLNRSTGGGLAGAIAKSKNIEHKPIKSPREQLRSSDGVKKI